MIDIERLTSGFELILINNMQIHLHLDNILVNAKNENSIIPINEITCNKFLAILRYTSCTYYKPINCVKQLNLHQWPKYIF